MPRSGGYDVVPRVIRTKFVAEWEGRESDAAENAAELRDRIMGTVQAGRPDELTPFAGQTAGMIVDVMAAGEIVRAMVAVAEQALAAPMPSP